MPFSETSNRTATTIRRQIAVAAAASIVSGLLMLVPLSPVAAGGCSHSDHVVGQPPGQEFHYYEGHFNSQNSHFHRWWEVTIAGAGYNYTWCGCLDPNKPCVNSVGSSAVIQVEHEQH